MDVAAVLQAHLASPSSIHLAREAAEENTPGLDQWQPLTERPPPPDEPALRTGAAALQNRISKHPPIDTAFDWSEVEIELPEFATRRDPTYIFWLDGVRNLIHFGLSWGWVTARQVASVASDSGSRDDTDEIECRLRLMLGDVGISVEDDPSLAPMVDQLWPGGAPVHDHDDIVDEAIAFIENLSQTRDLYTYYMKDIQQMEAVVRRLREVRR